MNAQCLRAIKFFEFRFRTGKTNYYCTKCIYIIWIVVQISVKYSEQVTARSSREQCVHMDNRHTAAEFVSAACSIKLAVYAAKQEKRSIFLNFIGIHYVGISPKPVFIIKLYLYHHVH